MNADAFTQCKVIMSLELVNSVDSGTIGIMVPDDEDPSSKRYQPLIMWNMKVVSYISAPPSVSSFRAYRCKVKMSSGVEFIININANDFHSSFRKVHEAIVNKTHGVLVLQKPIENSLWTEFVPKLLLESSDEIYYQRPALNTGLNCSYLEEKAFEHGGVIQLSDVEVVYTDVVYDGEGNVKEKPIHIIVPEAFPHKRLTVSPHKPSGLLGYLRCFLPPLLATAPDRRLQMQLALLCSTGTVLTLCVNLYLCFLQNNIILWQQLFYLEFD